MAGAALLSVTLVPVLMLFFVRGRILPEAKNPVNRLLIWLYRPVIAASCAGFKAHDRCWRCWHGGHRRGPRASSGSEFMPTLNEGTLFYMPASLPGMSVTKAGSCCRRTNRIIKTFPEVESVFGKAGRANTATDPAPLEMFETVINLKPKDEWRPGMTTDKLIAEMDKALQFPGVANSWTMPIKARIDMLSTGIRTPVGVKVFGKDLESWSAWRARSRPWCARCRAPAAPTPSASPAATTSTSCPTASSSRATGSPSAMCRTCGTALGGEMVTTTVEGLERYGVIVRYPRACATTRARSRPTCWCRPWAARCRSARSPRSS
jgi:Cu(I)/Ag(I) efflux system membrane protein CusA/SilA